MPDGSFIPANNLNRSTLSPYLAAGTAHEFQDGIGVDYSRGIVTVYLDQHGVMAMIIVDIHLAYNRNDIPGKPPALSTPDGNTVLEFPLKEKELEALFGKPTKDETYHFVT
jgi:hypothetical protein